jgi:hypothetical protein
MNRLITNPAAEKVFHPSGILVAAQKQHLMVRISDEKFHQRPHYPANTPGSFGCLKSLNIHTKSHDRSRTAISPQAQAQDHGDPYQDLYA